MYVKLAMKNIKSRQNDSVIYLVSLSIFTILLLSAFMLDAFPLFTENGSGIYLSNSLPWMIAMTMLFLMIYMNRFILRQRSKELGIYILSGATNKSVGKLYLLEQIFMGFRSLMVGSFLGAVLFGVIFSIMGAKIDLLILALSFFKTCLCFILMLLISLLPIYRMIRNLSLKHLMEHKKHNERFSYTRPRAVLTTILSILACGAFVYQITHISPIAVSTIAFSLIIFLYCSYSSVLGWLQIYRDQRGRRLYKNRRLFIVGQVLSGVKTLPRIASIISGCLLIAMVAAVTGYLFISDKDHILIEQNIDSVMGFAQMYIAVLFTVVVFSIVALQQIVDVREHEQKYSIIQKLGTDYYSLNRLLLRQVIINFTIPVIMAFAIAIISLLFVGAQLPVSGSLSVGFLYYVVVFLILYCCYIYATYSNLKCKVKRSNGSTR